MLVAGDRISLVAPASGTVIPAGAQRIDGRGKFLTPGFADMHVHLEYFENPEILGLFIVNGVTTVRNMDGRPQILAWKKQAATITAPRVYTAGPLLDGNPPVIPDNAVVVSAAEARSAVEAQAAAGYDFVKVYSALSLDAFRSIVTTARERRCLSPAMSHALFPSTRC